jgi:DnaJ-class molecular chaperone
MAIETCKRCQGAGRTAAGSCGVCRGAGSVDYAARFAAMPAPVSRPIEGRRVRDRKTGWTGVVVGVHHACLGGSTLAVQIDGRGDTVVRLTAGRWDPQE